MDVAKLSIIVTTLTTLTALGCIAAPPPVPAAAPPVPTYGQPATNAPIPIIIVKPSEDKTNRVFAFVACARGSQLGCVQAGSWLIAQSETGRKLKLCLHANGSPEDVIHCTEIEAKWPE